ncbi:MAG: hypothetical protein Q4P66_00315 [Actinomycetaceae bacterium]|nr:hypothetical protein [Actinomycetaceae bacterium]
MLYFYPGFPVIDHHNGSVQFGTAPHSQFFLHDLQPEEAQFVQLLSRVTHQRDYEQLRIQSGLSHHQCQTLLDRLSGFPFTTSHPPTTLNSDEVWWARQRGDQKMTQSRINAYIRVTGLDRVGFLLARQLVNAGATHIILQDSKPVTHWDIHPYPESMLGVLRESAAASLLQSPDCYVYRRLDTIDCDILVRPYRSDMLWAAHNMSKNRMHLPIILSEADITIGPLVKPGSTCCLRCVELNMEHHRIPVDHHDITHHSGVESILGSYGAALAAREVLSAVAGLSSALENASWRVRADTPFPIVTSWDIDPHCGCTMVDERY